MVSPSKHQHQQQQQQQQQQQRRRPSRENKSDPQRTSHVRIQKGLKPLEKKSFYLDIKNHVTAAKLEAKIRELGGVIELFLVRSVSLVISDRIDKTGRTSSEKHRWICASGGSGGPRSLRSIEVPTPTPTPPTPLLSSEFPSSNFTNLRGQTTQRSKSRVDAMLERALTQPQQCSVDPLDNAHNWGIPIWATEKLQAWLDKIYASFKDTYNLKQLKQINQRNTEKDLKVKHLKGSYIKFESFHRINRPVFLELSSWPTLNFDDNLGSCPFDTKKQGKRESKLTNKEIKENKEAIESTNRVEGKEMTRRPRTTTAARARKTEQLVAGYCEICHIHYDDLSKHLQSDQHLNFVGNDDNFLSLDTLINTGANVETFLKLNRTKDIEKDCDCFSNGDSNLHNAVLPEEKINKNTKTLNNFSVDEIKMVNGARRNLNLKLSSPHNLRTRAKHESGHLLRSKGSPWHEVDKNEKLYDKLEGFTIKKRSKGTIWIEEDDPDEKYAEEDILRKESKQEDYKSPFSNDIDDVLNIKEDNISSKHISNLDSPNLQPAIVHNNTQNGILNSRRISEESDYLKSKNECNGDENACALECINVENGVVDNGYTGSCKPCKDLFQRDNCALQVKKVIEVRKLSDDARNFVCNEYSDKSFEQKDSKVVQEDDNRCTRLKHPSRFNRRGGRSIRGRYRHRLSVEERLIEDNRAYYKVEVLGNKLRSSVVTGNGNPQHHAASKDDDGEEKKEAPLSSEKPVVVRFKRVRKSELSLLSDEAESFMFGEPKRDDSSEQISDSEQSSVLPKDTENSETNETANSSMLLSSPLNSSPVKQEIIEEDSQDSIHLGRARKRRRTQAEAFIKDNTDYYKFETPGSRLRYQAPLTGIKDNVFADSSSREHATLKKSPQQQSNNCKPQIENIIDQIYPSKPSTEIEKMQFSFEAIPKSEPWYQTYQRQDTGAEFWYCFSECDAMKPFLLPYEIENFHETLMKMQSRIDAGIRKRGRGRGVGCAGRSPRKSPRCHASTLAIMSTIIRKREQQQLSTLCTIEESPQFVRSRTNTPKSEQKQDLKSDVDEELKEIAKTIDDMLSTKDMELDDSFEPDMDLEQADNFCGTPKGAPPNLLELLDNCQDITNCLENNSSCASSECGEVNIDTPLKRRKRRKNRTGWPVGNKMKKKIQTNSKMSMDCNRVSLLEKRLYQAHNRNFAGNTLDNTSNKLPEEGTDSHTVTSNNNIVLPTVAERLNVNRKSDADALLEICTTNTSHKSCYEALSKRDKNVEAVNDDNTSLSTNTGSYVESLSVSENTCEDATNKNYLSNKDYPCRKDLSKIEEISENDESANDENHENQKSLFSRKDVNAITERNLVVKSSPVVRKQRQRDHVAAVIAVDNNSCESRDTEIENRDNIQLQHCKKETEPGIVPKKHHNTSSELSSSKRQLRGGNCNEKSSENTAGELLKQHGIVFAATRRGRMGSRKRIYSRKRQSKTVVAHNNLSSSDHHVGMMYDDENCKKDAYLNITSTCNKKQQSPSSGMRSAKRKSEAISSSDNVQESSDPMMDQCALSERVISPSSVISSTELEQRRSSIEFQPVVRMMKLDDQVDMDHGILSTVTVASNRRLRSSGGSPRSNNTKPPRKRIKSSGRGHFGRWLKSS